MELKNKVKQQTAFGITQARALLFTLESLPLPVMNRWITGGAPRLPSHDEQSLVIERVRQLLELDAKEFVQCGLPLNLLRPESPTTHIARWLKIMGDSTTSFWRRRNQETTQFSDKVKNLDTYPEYYKRNFHHQTDGYLTDQSAEIYDHQVELLFRGLADPMRRRLLKPLVEKFKNQKNIKILELGCGTGSFTRFLTEALPNAQITAIDLSPNYIKQAKKRLIEKENINFMVANAENLNFKDHSFDAVISVYLHHELPQKIREKVIIESHRVCKQKGLWALLDSIQLDDDPHLNWAIKDFPKTFHEPFFTNYIKNPILNFLQSQFPQRYYQQETYLLSKLLYTKTS